MSNTMTPLSTDIKDLLVEEEIGIFAGDEDEMEGLTDADYIIFLDQMPDDNNGQYNLAICVRESGDGNMSLFLDRNNMPQYHRTAINVQVRAQTKEDAFETVNTIQTLLVSEYAVDVASTTEVCGKEIRGAYPRSLIPLGFDARGRYRYSLNLDYLWKLLPLAPDEGGGA